VFIFASHSTLTLDLASISVLNVFSQLNVALQSDVKDSDTLDTLASRSSISASVAVNDVIVELFTVSIFISAVHIVLVVTVSVNIVAVSILAVLASN